MIELKIDPEFRDKIPPLTQTEYEQLRENIIEAGEIYEPIVTWNGVIIDGHNRYKIIRENPKIKWRTREMKFADRWEAIDWMFKNQLGRRNLTEQQREVLIGQMYKARKKRVGAPLGNSNAEKQCAQNANIVSGRTPRTDEILGRELGINHSSVIRAEHFADGVDALRKISSEAAEAVLRGEAKVTKATIRDFTNKEFLEQKEIARKIIEKEPINKAGRSSEEAPSKKNRGNYADVRETYATIDAAYKPMLDESAQEAYNIDDLVEEIKANGADYAGQLRRTIANRSTVLNADGARDLARKAIDEVILSITNVRAMV